MAESGNEKRRVFVALSLADKLRSDFDQLYRKLKISADSKEWDVRWTPQKNLHLTLKFIGSVRQQKVDEVITQLSHVAGQFEPVTLKLRGLGGFPDQKQTRVFWMGVQNQLALRKLHESIEEACEDVGLPKSQEDFTPHVTLGRLRNKKNIEDFISPFVRKDFGKLKVDTITLFESHLQGNFPVYKSLQDFKLIGSDTGEFPN